MGVLFLIIAILRINFFYYGERRLKTKRFKKSIYDVNVRETVIRLAHTCHPMSRVQVSKGNQSTSSKTQSKYTTLLLRCDFFISHKIKLNNIFFIL